MIARRGVILGGLLACGLGLPAAVAAGAAPTIVFSSRVVIVNDDGFSPFFSGDYRSVVDIRARIAGYGRAPVKVFEWCVGGGSRVNYPSKVTEMIGDGLTEFPRRGDRLAHETMRQFADSGVNLTQAVAAACHEAGIRCFVSLRMNGDYASREGELTQRQFNSNFWWQHAAQRVRGPKGEDRTRLSYAWPEVREFRLAILREIAACDIDGLNLDFMRHPPSFGYDEPLLRAFQEKYGEDARTIKTDDPRWRQLRSDTMTSFIASVRAMLDEAGTKRGRHLGLSVRVDWRDYRDWGCDIERWVKAGWLDYLVLAQHTLGGYEFDLKPFVAMAAGTRCQVYFGEEAVTSGHDLTPAEDKLVAEGKATRPPRDHLTPEKYGERAARWHEMGAAGVHLFNTHALDDVLAAATPWQK